jgi:predicted ArsR family transcriptional regulator
MSNNRGEGGKFASRVTDSDVIRALREYHDPVATATDLADVLGVTSETIRRHLTELHEQGRVDRKDVGARAVVWWLADERRASAPAAPLRGLVGMLDEEGAARVRERSQEVRAAIDEEVDETRRELTENHTTE